MTAPTYMPYGAYELKARYQMNLMLAMLITASTITLILLGAFIHGVLSPGPPIVPVIEPKVVSVAQLPLQEITIRRDKIAGSPARPAELRVGIPEPRPDDEFIDENIVIASREEIAELIDAGRPGVIGEGDGNFIIDTNVIIENPSPWDVPIVEKEPQMIHRHVPEYPRLAERAGITGAVWVRALVNEDGNVIDAIIHVSSRTDALDQAALEGAYKNKFSPAIQNGQPVRCWVSYKVIFELDH